VTGTAQEHRGAWAYHTVHTDGSMGMSSLGSKEFVFLCSSRSSSCSRGVEGLEFNV